MNTSTTLVITTANEPKAVRYHVKGVCKKQARLLARSVKNTRRAMSHGCWFNWINQ